MIAITGYLKYLNKEFSDISVTAKARLKVTENS
jgi:N6-L-threonylcarbamoyladenine synthase